MAALGLIQYSFLLMQQQRKQEALNHSLKEKADIIEQRLQAQFISEYRQQNWENANSLLKTIKENVNYNLSVLAKLYSDRIEDYKTVDLPDDWDGVYSATSK